MSKIGRKLIKVTSANIDIKNNIVSLKGPNGTATHEYPACLDLVYEDGNLQFGVKENTRQNRMVWGLHRALLANKVTGVEQGFKQDIQIVGLGYKAQASGKKIVFKLGYSHDVDFELPDGVKVDIAKSGQTLTVSSPDKFLLGNVCDGICALKRPEPYKGTGIMKAGEKVRRKAGKAKSA
jgi:large subunit ribosomal protein L6